MGQLPTIEKAWQFDTNKVFNASTGNARAAMLAIKNSLISFDEMPWEVLFSCDAVTAGTAGDLVDRWVDTGDIICHASSNHSWMVLKQSGVMENFQICIDFKSAANSYELCDVVVSPVAGFTGGSVTARPTATDEYEVTPTAAWTTSSTDGQCRFHIMMSTDGQCTHIFGFYAGLICSMWILDRLKTQRPEIIAGTPFCAMVYGSNSISTNHPTYADVRDTPNLLVRHNSINSLAYMTCEGCSTGSMAQLLVGPDDIDGSFCVLPIGVVSVAAGASGRYGEIYDLWFASSKTASGDCYDQTNARQVCQMRDFLTPSNGELLAVC